MTPIQRTARARLNQAIREADMLSKLGVDMREHFDGHNMQQMRDLAESILQCVHEFNAYTNAGKTNG